MERLFVYGTLKKGCRLHYIMEKHDAKYLSNATAEGYTIIIYNNIPFMVRTAENCIVKGQLYLVSPKLLRILDRIEAGYSRKKIPVKYADKKTIVWVYVEPRLFFLTCRLDEYVCRR